MKDFETKNYKLTIDYDNYPDSPREWDNLTKMVCFHGRYNLGDGHDYDESDFTSWDEMERAIKRDSDVAIIMPLWLYDHGGLSLATNRHGYHGDWDCGQVGFVFITKEDLRKEYNVKRITSDIKEKGLNILEGEVEIYAQHLSGEVYQFTLEKAHIINEESLDISKIDKDDLDYDYEFEDSCSGFYDIRDMFDHLPEDFIDEFMEEYPVEAIEYGLKEEKSLDTLIKDAGDKLGKDATTKDTKTKEKDEPVK